MQNTQTTSLWTIDNDSLNEIETVDAKLTEIKSLTVILEDYFDSFESHSMEGNGYEIQRIGESLHNLVRVIRDQLVAQDENLSRAISKMTNEKMSEMFQKEGDLA